MGLTTHRGNTDDDDDGVIFTVVVAAACVCVGSNAITVNPVSSRFLFTHALDWYPVSNGVKSVVIDDFRQAIIVNDF